MGEGSSSISCSKIPPVQNIFIPWVIGVGLAGITSALLPLCVRGGGFSSSKSDGALLGVLMLSFLSLLIGASSSTFYAKNNLPPRAKPGEIFFPLAWASVGCMFGALALGGMEWRSRRGMIMNAGGGGV
ncbi:hypothetical protein AJ80_04441 [Polytolypa hystricis UAMH7299]|uniref:Uncharacterized protein n=1 Tax=Polytolypa hystricis (strain UAMH7299) TaxID=1447883 RepID=A0A2B7YBP2_POLH7|nr:hypothetical protein AJ80_04441 [Polytolypa hystricis UAMH7299]